MPASDIFVVGGGPAGLAAAIAARRKGLRVTLADASVPPIDKACGEGLMPDSLSALSSLGIQLDRGKGAVLRGIRFIGQDCSVEADFPNSTGLALRRTVLHEQLIEHARAAGVELRWGVKAVRYDAGTLYYGGDRVRPAFVVGADGLGSQIRKSAQLSKCCYERTRYAFRRHFRVEPWSDYVEVYWGKKKQVFVTPIGANEIGVAVVSSDPKVRVEPALQDFPELRRRLRGAAASSTERGALTVFRRLKRVCTEHVALVGDASGAVDSITGQGICHGFRQATVLARALERGALRDYERGHREVSRRARVMTRLLLLLTGNEWICRKVLAALSAEPSIFEQLLALHIGQRAADTMRVSALLRFGGELILGE